MRTAFLVLLVVAGGFRFVEEPAQEVPAKPPVEIRLVASADPDLERRISEIQAGFPTLQRHRTRRFEILTDLSGPEAARDGQLLERTAHAVDDFGLALGYPSELRTERTVRHLVIAFAGRDDFIRFSRGQDQVDGTWLGGYFSPAGPHLVYYDASEHPAVRRARDRLDRGSEGGGSEHEVLDAFVTKANAAVVVHEATHMLLHDRDIAPADSKQSDWLLEGLAGSFEPAQWSQRFGPLRPLNARTGEFRQLLAAGAQTDLHDLVSRPRFPREGRQSNAYYATSAALCSWLARNRPKELRRYLDLANGSRHEVSSTSLGSSLVEGGPGAGNADARVPETRNIQVLEFEGVFGDLDRLQRVWIRSERAAASIPVVDATLADLEEH